MFFKEFEPTASVTDFVHRLSSPWNPMLVKGIYQCFERNFGFPAEMLQSELDWAQLIPKPEPKDVKIYLILSKNGNLIRENKVTPDWVRGFYILRETNLEDVFSPRLHPNILKYTGKGIQGVALALDKEYRGTGIGKKLINVPYTLGADYIWGMHLDSLNNLKDWLKRRELVFTNGGIHVTATRLKK